MEQRDININEQNIQIVNIYDGELVQDNELVSFNGE